MFPPVRNLPVFFDPLGRRAYIVTTVIWVTVAWLGVSISCLIATSITGPSPRPLEFSDQRRPLSPGRSQFPLSTNEPQLKLQNRRSATVPAAKSAIRYAHLVNWDENSFSALKRNAQALDVVIAEWLHLGDFGGSLMRDSARKEARVRTWINANAPALKLFPLVNNYDAKKKRWDVNAVAAMLAFRRSRWDFAHELYRYIVDGGYPGLVIDLEVPTRAQADFTDFVQELGSRFRRHGLKLLVTVPPADPNYEHVKLAHATDALILTTHHEHADGDNPGPLAGQGWFEAMLEDRFRHIDPRKLIVGIGSYAYDWAAAREGKEVSVQEAWELLRESAARLHFDQASLNPTFEYVDKADGTQHQVWYLDAVTGYNQVAAALAMQPAGLALWRLGTEDPAIWAAFGRERLSDAAALNANKSLQPGYDLLYRGNGEILDVAGVDEPGTRTISFDPVHNLITDQELVAFPKSTTVTRRGARGDKVIALTFDDGPDPIYTPQILDILAVKDVRATFFIVGSAGVIYGDLLKRMYREGHDIGNHTFTHVNSAEVSVEHLKFEINATQRLLEATIGARTKLFRPPYAADLEPMTIDGAEALRVSGLLGYLTVGMNIDPKDWLRPLARQIVDHTVASAKKGEGNVVLLHDAGGTRTSTIAALPQIIDKLRVEGFRFVTIHELLKLKRDEVMPRVKADETLVVALNQAGFSLFSGINSVAVFLFHFGLALGIVRLIWVAGFALAHVRRERRRPHHAWLPPSFAVVIPAYNEDKVICTSIHALLASSVANFEIIVVDDGSTDRTAEVARRMFAHVPRVCVMSKPNEGKWAALNHGLAHTDAEIVIMLDADTIFEPDALALLVRHFANPKIAAVAGHATVGNCINLITWFQAIEYVTHQNLDRRALDLVNGITVVPGAIGAWRRDALLSIGAFSSDTLAEDADATIKLELAGWRVIYEPRAIARTEAPETISAFLKQRQRWMFGTLQVAFKNRAAIWRGRPIGVAVFGLPSIFVFQFLFVFAAPLIDAVLIWTIAINAHQLFTIGICWALFQVLEMMTAALAISIDCRSPAWRQLPLLMLQRFCYRQLLYITCVRVVFAALKGQLLGWGKLRRTGHVILAPACSDAAEHTILPQPLPTSGRARPTEPLMPWQ